MGVTIVISGSERGAGKTAVGCALIQALPEWAWTAVKITPDLHADAALEVEGDLRAGGMVEAPEVSANDVGASSTPPSPLKIGGRAGSPRVFWETDASSQKSTGRYLAAGARRAALITVATGWGGEPFTELELIAKNALYEGNLLVESNRFIRADAISLVVTGVTIGEWKQSFWKPFNEADALVLTHGIKAGDLPARPQGQRVFSVRDGAWAPPELVEFVLEQMRCRDIGVQGKWEDTECMATLPVQNEYRDELISVREYLRSSFSPDCEYVDGRIEERNVGEKGHSILQMYLGFLFMLNRTAWGIEVYPELRTQTARTRFRVPDVLVTRAGVRFDDILDQPPLIAIEILSPEDRLAKLQEKIAEYLEFGVEHLWIFDPQRKVAWRADHAGMHVVADGELTVPGTKIRVVLSEAWAELERM